MSDRDVLIAIAPEVDATALAAWVLAQDGVAEVIVTPLSDIGDDPALGFRGGRAIIGLRSGDLLLPSTLAGAEVLLQRPEGSYAIVLTAAERIRTEADVAAVQRAVDGALLGRPSGSLSWLDDPGDATGRSQPPARGWLLFSQQEVVPLLAGQVARDAEALSRWLAAAPEGQRELAGRRARHQQDVAAETRSAETARPGAARGARFGHPAAQADPRSPRCPGRQPAARARRLAEHAPGGPDRPGRERARRRRADRAGARPGVPLA
jgi:hypothetical protein